MSRENAAFVTASGNAGITFETQGRCENEACPDYGREFAPGEWLEPVDGQVAWKDPLRAAIRAVMPERAGLPARNAET
jgi:hypothetical protein